MFPETLDTIVAASTPSGRSLCSIIKISGPEAIQCIKDIFIPAPKIDLEFVPTYIAVKGHIYFPDEYVNIPVVLYIMKQPYSYTKEDIVEIHTFGSSVIIEMLLGLILSTGVQAKRSTRLSQPGEFTKRAFLNGRIDLTQAEATMRIIRAQTDRELNIAVAQLEGDISQKIKCIQDEAVSLCSYIEAAIDFSDQDIELISTREIVNRLEAIGKNISQLLVQFETTKISLEGIDTVLYGKPNVGKSSLINALLGKRRSIVSEIPGTTRDVVTDILEIGNIRFKLMDTAGMDGTKGAVLSKAMEKTRSILKKAQVILLVFDNNADMSEQLKEMELEDLTDNVIVVINKCDLQRTSPFPELPVILRKYPFVYASALTGEGLERLKEVLVERVIGGQINLSGDSSIFTARQREALECSLQSIRQSRESVRNNESFEFVALNLRAAIDILGEIVGEVTTEDILDKIFSEFCIGK